MRELVKENRNQPAEPYLPPKVDSFESAVKVFKETSPEYSALHKRARYLAHKYGYVNANTLKENAKDLLKDEGNNIIGAILCPRNFQEGGLVRSNDPKAHGRRISNWRLK